MVKPAQFYAAHGVTSYLRWRNKWCSGYLPWVSVYSYSKRLDGESVQHIFRGNVEFHGTIDWQFEYLALAGHVILWIVKRPEPLLPGHLDNKLVGRRGNGVLVETKHAPDEQEKTEYSSDAHPANLET